MWLRWRWYSNSDGEALSSCLIQNLLKDFHGLHRFTELSDVHETSTAAGSKDDPLISSQKMWQWMPVSSAPLSRCWGFRSSQGSVITKVELRRRTTGFSGLKLVHSQFWIQTQPQGMEKMKNVIFLYWDWYFTVYNVKVTNNPNSNNKICRKIVRKNSINGGYIFCFSDTFPLGLLECCIQITELTLKK